jgi:hypothetical protein
VNSLYSADSSLKANVRAYRSGKRDFSINELNEIKVYLLKLKELLSTTEFFEGNIKYNRVVSCFCEAQFYDEELFEHIFNRLNAAIGIIVILSEKRVLLQRNQSKCNIDLCNLAKLLCDGDCENLSIDVAAGKITEKFLKFSKTLQACTTQKI